MRSFFGSEPVERRVMFFEAPHRHEVRTSGVGCLEHSVPGTDQAHVLSILGNHSRAILASAVTLARDANARDGKG